MIVGTAGHIDHGKTTLVRALTGVDTDRLKEEKVRGISIELGYAYVPLDHVPSDHVPFDQGPLDSGDVLGFVDVPGHERLVHTMVAGAAGIDFALLVVAADDGVMPQTREHLAILELLGIERGAVALTKIDRVDGRRLQQVDAEVRSVVARTTLRDAPIFALNATFMDDPGTAALRRYLHEAAARMPSRRDEKLFRLAVDRVFTLAGHGTVVTGTVFAGQIGTGDTVTLMPANRPVRVRSIHAQNRAAERGYAGQRCALNLVGVEKSAISRGDWLADARVLAPTTRIDVRLRLLADTNMKLGIGHPATTLVRAAKGATFASRSPPPPAGHIASDASPCACMRTGVQRSGACAAERHRFTPVPGGLVTWSPIHVHFGTTHRVAHVVLLESDRLAAGETARVQLIFDTPVCALPGDPFIARDAQAAHTIGGGRILDPFAPSRKRRSGERLRYLDAIERMTAGDGVAPLLQDAPFGVNITDLVRLTGRAPEHISLPSDAVVIGASHERFVLLASHWSALRERAVTGLRDFHANVPDEPGPDAGRLRRIVLPDLAVALWRVLIDELTQERIVMRNGPWLHLPEHTVTLSDSDRALVQQLQPLIATGRPDAPLDAPWVRDLAAAVHQPEERVRQVLRKQVTQGAVYQVVNDLFYDSQRIEELADIIAVLAREHGAVNAARYRDAIGLGRKRTIQILEFFDRIGYTRRVHDVHVLRTDSGWRGGRKLEWRKAHAPGGTAGLQTQEGASDASW